MSNCLCLFTYLHLPWLHTSMNLCYRQLLSMDTPHFARLCSMVGMDLPACTLSACQKYYSSFITHEVFPPQLPGSSPQLLPVFLYPWCSHCILHMPLRDLFIPWSLLMSRQNHSFQNMQSLGTESSSLSLCFKFQANFPPHSAHTMCSLEWL